MQNIDRRNCMRFNIPLALSFKKSNGSDSVCSGITYNFSRMGFCFESHNSDIGHKDNLELTVELPEEKKAIPVMGDIIWIRQDGTKYLVGMRLREIKKESKWKILDCCYDSWLHNMRTDK
jgi:c-di-GMP-binding flagellar brake protein YcgR